MEKMKILSCSGATVIAALLLVPAVHAENLDRDDTARKDSHLNSSITSESDMNTRGRMSDTRAANTTEVQEDVREVVREMIAAAVNGDVEDYVDYLAKEDRERIEHDTVARDINGVSESFTSNWKNRFNRSLESGLGEFALPVKVNSVNDRMASVTVGSAANESVQLKLVKGGWFNTAWRVDAPNSLDLATLQSKLSASIREVERTENNQSESQALTRAAIEVLKPVGAQG